MGRFRNYQERDATRERERREAESLREERREAAHHAEIADFAAKLLASVMWRQNIFFHNFNEVIFCYLIFIINFDAKTLFYFQFFPGFFQ